MARWAVFAGLTALVLALLLALARLSQSTVSEAPGDDTQGEALTDLPRPDRTATEPSDSASLSTGLLLANVALSQGLFLMILLGGAWYTRIPLAALGATPATGGLQDLAIGIALGTGLYLVNEFGSRAVEAVGIETPTALRESLAPDTTAGWVVLLALVLPTIAVFEEFLFRAALVGAFSAGFSLSPWLLAVLSSVAFALGHGAQGALGMVVTGGLGFVLAGAFVVTGSLLVVVVAHYLVNALEFVVNEGSMAD